MSILQSFKKKLAGLASPVPLSRSGSDMNARGNDGSSPYKNSNGNYYNSNNNMSGSGGVGQVQRPSWWMDAPAIRSQGVHDSAKRVVLLNGHWESLEHCIRTSYESERPLPLDKLPIRNNLAAMVALLCEEDR